MKQGLVVLLVLCLLGAGGWWWWTNTPTYAVQQASNALKHHDLNQFDRWVEIHTVCSAAVDDLVSEPVRSAGGGVLERIVGSAIVTIFKPTVVETMDSQVKHWVSHQPAEHQDGSGTENDAGGSDGDAAQNGEGVRRGILGALKAMVRPPSLREVFADYGLTAQNYRGLGSTDSSGDVAHVGLRFFSPKAKREVEIKLELNKIADHWKISRISNLQQIVPILAGIT
jgi:hypothetical protein